MKYLGNITKMKSVLSNSVEYFLPIGENKIEMNSLLGNEIKISWTGEINCVKCGKATKTSFFQGFCYNCFQISPETAPCILNPELCEAHLGISRDMEWAQNNCLQDHFVYLSLTSGLKVGVTRASQIPTRWIDQGAVKAIKIAKTPNRNLAGLIEVDLKQYFSDKTAFQKMLKTENVLDINLKTEKNNASELLRPDLSQYLIPESEIVEIKYPILKYPTQIISFNLDKEKSITGNLMGIKGQYLIFSNGNVLNIRKYSGYKFIFEY